MQDAGLSMPPVPAVKAPALDGLPICHQSHEIIIVNSHIDFDC